MSRIVRWVFLLLLLFGAAVALAEDPAALLEQCEAAEHGKPDEAIELADRALAMLADDDVALRFQVLGCKGWALSSLGQRAEVMRIVYQLEGLAGRLIGPVERVRALRRLSALHHRMGDLERSTELLRTALEQTEIEDLPEQRIDLLVNLGAKRAEARQHDSAISLWLRALELIGDDGDPRQSLPVRYNLGIVFRAAERYDEAIEMLEGLLEPLSEPGMEIRLASLKTILGSIYLDQGLLDEAQQFLSASSQLHEQLDNPAEHTALLNDKARLHIELGNIDQALAFSEQAVAEAERADYHFSIVGALAIRAQALEAAGKYDQALAVERDRAGRVERFLVDQQRSELDELEAELGLALRERELADLRREREAQARRLESQQQREQLLTVVLVGLILLGLAVMIVQRLNNRRLARSSRTDELTSLGNRRQANEWLANAPDSTMLLMVDLDHFKEINDTHGHAFGDRVLAEVGACLAEFAARYGGKVARWGGEEFIVILPGKDAAAACAIGRDLRQTIAEQAIQLRGGGQLKLTASVGVTSIAAAAPDGDVKGWESALLLADELMYQAKHKGRNRTVILWPEGGETYRVADLKSGEVEVVES